MTDFDRKLVAAVVLTSVICGLAVCMPGGAIYGLGFFCLFSLPIGGILLGRWYQRQEKNAHLRRQATSTLQALPTPSYAPPLSSADNSIMELPAPRYE